MKEFTYIIDAQITVIIKGDLGLNVYSETVKRNLAQLIKEKLGVDDVNVLSAKEFMRDLAEEKENEETDA